MDNYYQTVYPNQGNQTGMRQSMNQNSVIRQQPMQFDPRTYTQPEPARQPIVPLTGHLVEKIDDVVPKEVPMDGTFAFFPICDGSAIYVKGWSLDGSKIETYKFVPENPSGPIPKTTDERIMERLDNIEKMLKAQNKFNKKNGGHKNEFGRIDSTGKTEESSGSDNT